MPREKSRVHRDHHRFERIRQSGTVKRPTLNASWRWVCSECGVEAPCALHPRAREVRVFSKPRQPVY